MAEFPGDGLQPLIDFKQWNSRVSDAVGLPVGNKTREKLRKLKPPTSFPSEMVREAYLHPSIDESKESFSWAVPNLVAVRDFALERFVDDHHHEIFSNKMFSMNYFQVWLGQNQD